MTSFRLSARGKFSKKAEHLYKNASNKSEFIFEAIEFYSEYHDQYKKLIEEAKQANKFIDNAIVFFKTNANLDEQLRRIINQLDELRGKSVFINGQVREEIAVTVEQQEEPLNIELTAAEKENQDAIYSTLSGFMGVDDD